MKKILIILLIVFVGIIVFIAWPQSGPSFRLVSYYQTDVGYPETTGTRRVQSIYVNNFEDTPEVWETIEKYAKKLTWFEGDANFIFFFKDKENTPDVTTTTAKFFDAKYEKYCIAAYYRLTSEEELFKKYPFIE